MRTIDTEHNWFWQQGYHDGLDGLRAIAPDETRYSFQRSDYFAGYDAGSEDRASRAEPMTLKFKTLVTGLVLGAIGMWIFPLVTGMGCIQ